MDSYKLKNNEESRQKAEIMKMHMNIQCPKTDVIDIMEEPINYKRKNSMQKSLNNKSTVVDRKDIQFQHLQNENISLLQKLNKKKAEVAMQKKQIDTLQRQYFDKSRTSYSTPINEVQPNSKLIEENLFLRNELKKKNKEISELYIENKLLKNDSGKIEGLRKRLYSILEFGAKEYDYLKGTEFKMHNSEELFDQINRLVEYLVSEKRALEEKYVKLLELHNNLLDRKSVV